MAGLKIGQIDDGFRYKGGDPSSQDSWEQADALKPGDIDGDYQFSGGEPSSSENWKPITAKSAGVIETIKQAGLGLAGKYSEGSGNSLSGVGRFLQAPAASALELLTGLGAAVSDEDHKPGRQALARDVSQFAQESRDENVANGNAFSVAGKGMEGVGQDAQRYWKQKTEEAAPIVTQQERNFSDAKGFVDSTKAAISNPLGVLGGVAQSMPDMVVGMGTASAAGKLAKKMATQEAMVAAEAAGKSAAVEAAAVPGATEASVAEAVQTARQTTFDTVRRDAAVRAATPAGSASEAAQSGMSTQAQVHEFVLQQPADQLYANNDYFRQMIDGGMQEAEAKQRLANSLSAEASGLAAIATRAGSAVTGGGVATAKTIVGGERMTGKELLKRTGQDTAEEAVQGIGEEYSQYRAQKQADPKQEYDFGGTVAKNAISGLVMGAGGHGTGYVTERLEQRGNPDGQTPMPGKEIAPVAETTKTKTADPKPASADDFVRIGELDSIAEERTLTAAEQQEYQSLLTKFNEADHGQLPTTTNAEVAAPGNAGAGNGLPGSGNVLGAVPNGNADNSNLSAGVAEAGMRPAESAGNARAPSLTYPAQQTSTRVLDQKPVDLAMPKLSPEHVEKVTAIDSRIDEIKAEIPTRTKAVQGSLQREAEKLAKEKALIVDQAHAAEGADPELMAQYNAAKQAGNNDEMRRLAHEINGQKKKEPAKAEAPKGEQVLSLGTMPNNAEPITVKNGIVYVGSYPAQDYDSGDDVTVPNGATPQQIRNALAKAGAIARGQKVFGLPADEKAPKQPKAARDKIDASKDSLFVAIAKLGGMDTQELLTNGFDRNDITQETAGRVSKKGKNAGKLGKKSRKPIAMGFALPLHKNGGMSFDGVLEALKQYGYFAEDATKNDAIDAFRAELGGDKHMTPDALMQQAEQDQAERDAMMAAEQDRIDAENAAEEAAKEESGYDDLSEEAQDIADDFGDIDNPANAKTGEDAMRTFGFTEDEINEQVRQGGESGTEGVAGKGSDAAGSRAETDRAGGGQDGQSQEKVPEGAKPGAGNEEGGKGRRTEVGGFEQGRVGMKLAAGQIVLTASGRETTPFPKFQSSTGKMNKSHLAAVDAWLLKNAEQEAVLRGDTFNSRQFERDHYDAVNRKTVPQASKDAAEEYLFGQQPADVPSILKSLVPDQNGGFTLAGQTPAEVKAQEAKRKADEEAAAKAAREPAGPTVKVDQVDLLSPQGGLFSSNREAPKAESASPAQDKEGADLTWPEVLDEARMNGAESGDSSYVPAKKYLEKAYQRTLTDEQVAEYAAEYQKGAREQEEAKAVVTSPEKSNAASWVIRDRATGAVIMETFDRKKVDALNMEKYEAIPIQKHLAGINKEIKAAEAKPKEKAAPTQAPSASDTAKEDAEAKQQRENPNIRTDFATHRETMDRLREGTATLAEYKAAFERLLLSQEEIKNEIGVLTKDAIFKKFPHLAWRYKNEKKADIVKAASRSMLDDFVLEDSIQWNMSQKYENVIRWYVEKETDESLRQFAEKVKRNKEERQQAREDAKQAVADPKTLEDFGLYLRAKINGGMTEQEARLSLSPEQRAKYDDLFAAETRSSRTSRSESAKAEVRVAAQTTTGQVIETKHTKTGEPLFVVKAADRVERDVYSQWNAAAKKLGGWYSSFRGNGAVPGFQFKTRENADAFLSFLGGDVQPAQEMVKERRDAFADDRSQSAVERLTEMADRLEEKADESLGRERKANTDRRARFAASAEAAANGEKALAKTMRNIAKAVESGSAKFLDRVRQKAQVEMLRSVLNTAQGEKIRAKYPTYLEQERHKGEAPNGETADYARWPSFTAFRSDLASLGRELSQIDGAKQIGKRLLSVADDVTDAYQKFAKENLHKVSIFSKAREGSETKEMAMFSTADAAESAIARSGYKGKATTISFKRGQHLVIMGPEMAKEAGLWDGDTDKRITLRPEFGEEIVAKARELKGRKISMPWVFDSASTERARWKGMGIESAVEMRAALREFVSLREAPAEADKIKQMERAMIGRKNDGLDFFPTPAETAKALIDAAGIEEGMSVLEPSAGMGHIAEQIREAGVDPDVIEYSNDRRELLEAKGFRVVGNDFMEMSPRGFTFGDVFRDKDGTEGVMRGLGGLGSNRVRLVVDGDERAAKYVDRDDLTGVRKSGYNSGYDRIIMNPPFSDRRDAEHVQHAYSLLKPGGRLVAIMGEGVFYGQDKKAQAFREWLDEVGGTSEKLPEGTFLDPSLPVNTSVNARMVVVEKPEGKAAMFSRKDQNARAKEFSETESAIGGRAAYDKAAAENRTVMSYNQWVQVRTPSFKRWWGGDWENGNEQKSVLVGRGAGEEGQGSAGNKNAEVAGRRENADGADQVRDRFSRALFVHPETGEPRVFFHGTRDELTEFDINHPNKKDSGWLGRGHYVTSERLIAETYARLKHGAGDPQVMELFVRPVNPFLSKPEAKHKIKGMSPDQLSAFNKRMVDNGHHGVATSFLDGALEIAVFDANSLKSATDNSGEFSESNDIRMARGTPGKINLQDLKAVVRSMSRAYPGVPIIPVENESKLPDSLRKKIKEANASGDVSGVFDEGSIYLVQSNIKDIEDAQVRAIHEVVHAGLSAMGVSDETFLNIGVSNPKLHSEARKIKAKYGYSFVTAIEEAMADMGPAARKLAGWKRVIANVRDKLRKLGFVRQWTDNDVEFLVLRALRVMKQKGAAVVSDKAMYSGTQQLRRKLTKDDTKMSALLTMLAEHDALFQQQAAFSDTPEEIGKEIDPSYPVKEQGPSSARAKGVDRIWEIGVPSSGTRSAYMLQKGDKVWLDLQRLLPGIDAGNKIYGIAAGYAHNTGRVLVGDPDGLSRMAFYRRTESMISSILKYGTSDHLEPHYAQTNPAGYYYDNGEAEFGQSVRAIDWEEGNTARNLRELIYTAYQGAIQNAPEIKNVYYDFDRHTFVQARPGTAPVSVAESFFSELSDRVSNRKDNPYRAGSATLKRAALVNTLVRRSSEAGRQDVAENGSQLRRAAAAWAASNSGLDPELRKIFYSRTGQTPDAALPEESKTEKARRVGQDKFLRFKVVQDWLKAQGVNVSDQSNVYRAETLMHSRASTRIEDFRDKQHKPLIKRIQKAGFALTDVAEYLEAKHTPEANQKQREIHKDPEATAAGVSDADALATVQKWEANPKFAEFAAMAEEVRSISDQTRDMLVKAGILSPEMAEAWQKAYQHYVPLKGGPAEPSAKIGAGPGLSVKAKQKRRLGHGERDEFVIENIIAAHEKAIRQVEKNRVGRTLALFLNEANNEEVGTIGKPAKRQVLKETSSYEVLYHGTVVEAFHNLQDARNFVTNESGRQNRSPSDFVVTKSIDPIVTMMASPMLAENEAVYYLHGKEIRLQLNDPLLARAYKNLGVDDLGKFLSIGRDINSWLSKAYTGYNLEFLLVNIVRDFSTGIINMTGDLGAGFALKVVKNYPAAMKDLWKSKDGNYTQLIKDYRDDGGSTGAAYLSDLERVGNDLQRAYDDARGVKATWQAGRKLGSSRVAIDNSIAWVMTYVEHLNRVGENAMRVALYKTLRDAGKSRSEAAEAAKNVTVNFNRKGEIASQAGAAYLFFNPNVQGTAKLLETMLNSPHKRQANALIAGMAGLAFILANIGRGDDEDEWRNIPSHVKDRNLVFTIGGKQITLPVPYGYGFFHMLGNAMSDLTHGVSTSKVAMNLVSGFFEHFSPVGNPFAGDEANSKNLVQLLPTLARIPGEIAVNRTGMGGPIMPEKPEWDKHKPDSQTLFRSTKGGFLAGTAEAMNSATGGTKYESGAIDVSPETLKYLIRTFAGGTGTFFGDAIGLGIRGAQGAAPEFREIPVVRKFVREESIQDVRRRYYEATDEAKKATNELAAARRNHDADGAQNIIAEKRELIAMGRVADKMRKSVSAQRDAQDRIMQDDDLSLPEKRSRVKALENEEAQLYNRYLKLFQEKEVERSERKKAVNQ